MSKKFINQNSDVVRESLKGLLWQHHPDLQRLPNTDAIVVKSIDTAKIQIISGGGSGHEPAHVGFVGNNFALSGAVCGGIFASPSHKAVFETLKYFKDCKKGVLVVIKNYQGDIINFNLAAQMAKAQFGMKVECIVFGDDVTFAYDGEARRGVAGTVLFYSVLAHIARCNKNFDSFTVDQLAERARVLAKNFHSYGVALESCILPGKSKPNVDLKGNEMELGLGIHGEAGNKRLTSIIKADEVAELMVQKVLSNLPRNETEQQQQQVVLTLNNLGGVTELEMGILVNSVMNRTLAFLNKNSNVVIKRLICGRFLTSLDMKGISLTALFSNNSPPEVFQKEVLDAFDSNKNPSPASVSFSVCSNIEEALRVGGPACASSSSQEQEKPEKQKAIEVESTPEGALFRTRLEAIFKAIDVAADRFDELDAAVGDGDMGRGISRGMKAALSILPTLNFSEKMREAFSELGSAIADAHAGSSGPMIGALVAVGGSKLCEKASENISGSQNFFLEGLAAGVDAVQEIGGAQEGDRTLVDVLSPLRSLIRSGQLSSSSTASVQNSSGSNNNKEILEILIRVAKERALAVQQLTAKKGRSRYAEDRCIGKPDPGCEFIVFVLEKILEIVFLK